MSDNEDALFGSATLGSLFADARAEDAATPKYMISGPAPVNVPRTVVRKEVIPGIGTNAVMMPHGARLVHVGYGRAGQALVHLWFECVSANEPVEYRFRAFATGDMIPARPDMVYVGTAQDPSMSKAWHIYQEV